MAGRPSSGHFYRRGFSSRFSVNSNTSPITNSTFPITNSTSPTTNSTSDKQSIPYSYGPGGSDLRLTNPPYSTSSPHSLTKHVSSFPSDPAISGPGLWFMIHRKARYADTPEKIREFIIMITDIIDNHPCRDCRNHGGQYQKLSPPENFVDHRNKDGEYNGMFYWSWLFHNAVNTRLGKLHVDYDTAWNMYSDDETLVCTIGCGAGEKSTPEPLSASSFNHSPSLVSQTRSIPSSVSLGSSVGTNYGYLPYHREVISYDLSPPTRQRTVRNY